MKNNILGNILTLIILSPILFLTVGIICITVQKPTRVLSSLLRLDLRVNDPIYILALLLFLLALIILALLEAICWFIAYRRIIDELF
jgi:hypothetical protein